MRRSRRKTPARRITTAVSEKRIVAPEVGEPVNLSPVQERELTEAMAAIRRGDYVDGSDLLAALPSLPRV